MNQANSMRFVAAALIGLSLSTGIVGAQVAPPAAPAAASPATQPTSDDVQSLLDSKQYPAAIKAASKLLTLHGPAAENIDRFDLMMKKGYAQAGLKSNSAAISTFKLAEKETKDQNLVAVGKWTAELFRTAGSNSFTPKTTPLGSAKRGPFDLLDNDARKQAFGALLDDNLAVLDPKLKSATISQSLKEIWPVVQNVVDLAQLDQIANGSDDKTQTLASGLLDHARNLCSNALKENWARVGDIDTHANIITTVQTQQNINNSMVTQNVSKKNGLSQSNQSELKNMITASQQIHDAAEAFITMAKTDKDWSTVLSDADRVAGKASDVLNADYGTTTTETNTTTTGLDPTQQLIQNQFPGNTVNNPVPPPKKSNGPTKNKPGQ